MGRLPFEKLQLTVRVGVTGTRAIPAMAEKAVRAAVATVLGHVRTVAERLAAAPGAETLWAAPHGRVVPLLRIVSPLAEGADRLVAEEALRLGFALEAILPFPQAEYERDFGEKVDRFRALLAHAGGRVLALDGGRGADEWRSYEAAGRLVVRNCDLLIAVWDPDVAAKGRGGTEDTIRFAAEEGPSVWWVHAAGTRSPALIERMTQVLDPHTAPTDDDAAARLDAHLGALLQPPPPRPAAGRGLLDRGVATLRQMARAEPDELRAFLRTREPRRRGLRVYDRLMHMAARRAPFRAPEAGLVPAGTSALSADSDVWAPIAARARRLAARWTDRTRTGGLLIVGVACIGAAGALIGLSTGEAGWNAMAALSAMVVAMLALAARLGRWRERWRACRQLAEIAQAQQALRQFGWSSLQRLPEGRCDRRKTRSAWIDWYAAAVERAAPPATGALGGVRLTGVCRMLDQLLVSGQATYHFNRRSAAQEAARRLDDVAHIAFLVGGVCLLIAALAGGTAATAFGIAAILLMGVSAATLALRAIDDLDALAAESQARETLVECIEARLAAVDAARPLASQDLAADLTVLLAAMSATAR